MDARDELIIDYHPHRNTSKYKPEYCERLIDHMAQGMSFESFAGKVRVSKGTLFNWYKDYPDFKEAKEIGEACLLYFFENVGNEAIYGQIEHFNASVWIFKMKNLCGWRDKHELQIEAKPPKKVIVNNLNLTNITEAPKIEGVVDESTG